MNRDSLSCAFKCCCIYVGGSCHMVGKDPIAGGKKSYPGNPAVMRCADGVLRNRGEYEGGEMVSALPISYEEFRAGVEGDQLRVVLEDGHIKMDQSWDDIRGRVRVDRLEHSLKQALDNLEAKCELLQKLNSDEAVAVRLVEASCGSKWMDKHPTKLPSMRERFPQYCAAMVSLYFACYSPSLRLLRPSFPILTPSLLARFLRRFSAPSSTPFASPLHSLCHFRCSLITISHSRFQLFGNPEVL